MRKVVIAAAVLAIALPAFAVQRTFEATYVATIANVPAGLKELRVWIPLPTNRGWQKISELQIPSPYVWIRKTDPEFGNDYAFTTIQNPPAGDITVRVRFKAIRDEARSDKPADDKPTFRNDRLVKVTSDLKKLAQELTVGKKGAMDQARAIFDYVVSSAGSGDCGGANSLFMTLARAKGIPARFVVGFPLESTEGNASTGDCWAEFYVKRKGWIPLNASKRDGFAILDADRLEYALGRDLRLEPRTSEPVNDFIYPYAEAEGKPVGEKSVSLQFREVSRSVGASR